MSSIDRLARYVVAFGFAPFALASTSAAQLAQAGTQRKVFYDPPPGFDVALAPEASTLRSRAVLVDVDAFRASPDGESVEPIVLFDLFDDVQLRAERASMRLVDERGSVSSYRLLDDPTGYAHVSVVGDSVTATVRTATRLFKVLATDDAHHVVLEENEERAAACGSRGRGISAPRDGSLPAGNQPEILGTDPYVFDILVVYTTFALEVHGPDGILSLINLAVYEGNEALANSDCDLRINLKLTREVTFDEVGDACGEWKFHMRNPNDGDLDEIHAWRDEYGADAVLMITSTGGGWCGCTFTMDDLGPGHADSAFATVHDGCATGNLTFVHELGHIWGSTHDRASAGSNYIFDYSFGFVASPYKTVMATSSGSRRPFFSNPHKETPNGDPFGVEESAELPAENWKSLNDAATVVTEWREAQDQGHTLRTPFDSDNSFAGNMFDIVPKSDVTLEQIDIHASAPFGVVVSIDVWYRGKSWEGHEDSGNGWKMLAAGAGLSSGPGIPTPITIPNTKLFRAGRTYGIYVNLTSYGAGNTLRYTSGGPTIYENNDLKLVTGVGKGVGFAGPTFYYRAWNGILHYRGADGTHELTTLFAENNGAAGNMFDLKTKGDRVRITSFDVNVDTTDDITVDVWYRSGSYQGHEYDPYAWKLLATDLLAGGAGTDQPTSIAFPGLVLAKHSTYGFYVNLASYELGQSLRYTGGASVHHTPHLKLTAGVGRGPNAFFGALFEDRTWNGTVHYNVLPGDHQPLPFLK